MSDYERPVQRKGYTLTAVWHDAAGRITRTVYEPIVKDSSTPAAPESAQAPKVSRGATAEQARLL